jgi:hypothetical protein
MSVLKRLRRPTSPVAQALLPIVAGVAFLAVLFGGLWVAASLVSSGKANLRVGSATFDKLRYDTLARDIAANGPRLYPSLIGTTESYLYVNHLGDDATKGWYAFNATRAGQPNKCTIVWKPVAKLFEDPCDNATYPPNGEGLQQYDAITNFATKRLVIDLKNPIPAATSTTTAISTTTVA